MQIREYNSKFGDDRSIKRSIVELPFVLARVVDYIFSFRFLLYFIKNTFFLKFAIGAIFYIMIPVDFMPASVFGLLGYIDNAVVLLAAGLYAVGKIGLEFIRQR
jgi:RING finger protein 170